VHYMRRHAMEAEAGFKLGQFMRREFGLSPVGVTAEICGSVLRVTLEGAVSPMGRVVAQAQGSGRVLEDVYDLLHSVNQDRMHDMISRILGVPVRQSMVEADLPTWDVLVTFRLMSLPLTERRFGGAGADMAHSCLK